MNPIILGDGLLGSEIRRQTNWNYLSRKKNWFDFSTDLDNYLNIIRYNEYDTIVNCIACTNTYGGTEEEHKNLNYHRVKDLVDFCNTENKKLVHISTDYLYANSKPDAKETDLIRPVQTYYGQFKNYGDLHVEMECKNFLIIRTSFKPYPFPYDLAVNQVGNFDYVNIIAGLIVQLINKDAKGVFNVGTEKKSMYDLAMMSRKFVGKTGKNNPLMPEDISMDVSKMENFLK